MPEIDTRAQILSIARALLASDGIGGISFDAIARRLERSKQAVLYWFPTKQALIAAMFLPELEAETDAVERAVADADGPADAIARFVHAVGGFHLADFDRFRMMYLVPQTTRSRKDDWTTPDLIDHVHPVTDRLYSALAQHLDTADADRARARAMTIHAAVLGNVLMVSLANALGDPLKHSDDALLEALIRSLTGGDGV